MNKGFKKGTIIPLVIIIVMYFTYAIFKAEEDVVLYEKTQVVREGVVIENGKTDTNGLEDLDIYSGYDQYGSPYIISE